jgi:putative colanic acid biosynthesis acetyltransferase WcaB
MTATVIIGNNCILRHSTTIGNKQSTGQGFTASPVIGNYVDIGSNVCIIGPIRIGDHSIIGCGAIVVKDVAANHVATGNPASQRPIPTNSSRHETQNII